MANGGTIFLDEVGELPLPTQARLLRVLESGEFMKVGSSEVQRTDIRVVAATNVNLQQAIQEKKFREDLFYRLNTVTLELPPLRDREGDVALLFRKFAADFADKYHMPPIRLTDDALTLLNQYTWPGNIRQLRNIVERLSVVSEGRTISREVLANELPQNADVRHPAIIEYAPSYNGKSEGFGHEPDGASISTLYKMILEMRGTLGELTQLLYRVLQAQQTMAQVPSIPQQASAQVKASKLTRDEAMILEEVEELLENDTTLTLEEMEQKYIELVLRKNNGIRKKAAEELGISERTLYRKLYKSK